MSIKSKIKKIIFIPSNIYNYIILKFKHVSIGKKVRINGRIRIMGAGKIVIGNNVTINSTKIINPVGKCIKTTFYVINNSKLIIGENTGISNSIICCSKNIVIGNNVKIGGGCEIYDTDFHSLNYLNRRKKSDTDIVCKSVKIGDDVFIGSNTLILKGVDIGNRSIIGSGSVVTKSIPKDEIWAGNPAKFIRKINIDR